MAKITIKRRNESERADGRAALYAVVNIERTKIRIPVDIAVTSDEWDPIAERIKGRTQEVKDSNLILGDIEHIEIPDIVAVQTFQVSVLGDVDARGSGCLNAEIFEVGQLRDVNIVDLRSISDIDRFQRRAGREVDIAEVEVHLGVELLELGRFRDVEFLNVIVTAVERQELGHAGDVESLQCVVGARVAIFSAICPLPRRLTV